MRRAREKVADEPQRVHRFPLELVVAPDPGEAQEDERQHRAPRRSRVVVERLLPCDELLAVRGCEEEAAALLVAEEPGGREREPPRLVQPPQIAGREVQLVEAVRDVRVVVEEGRVLRVPVAKRPPQRISRQELTELDRRSEEVQPLEPARALGEGRER